MSIDDVMNLDKKKIITRDNMFQETSIRAPPSDEKQARDIRLKFYRYNGEVLYTTVYLVPDYLVNIARRRNFF